MKLVKLDDDVWVNPEHVVSVQRVDRGTMLQFGAEWNGPGLLVELDVYEVLDRLDAQRAEAEAAREVVFHMKLSDGLDPVKTGKAINEAMQRYRGER